MKPVCQNSYRQKNIYDRILPFKENCMPEFVHTKTKVMLYSVCLRPKYMLGLLEKFRKSSAGADGGPHSRVCAHLTLRSAPHRHRQKFSAHVSGRGVKEIPIF